MRPWSIASVLPLLLLPSCFTTQLWHEGRWQRAEFDGRPALAARVVLGDEASSTGFALRGRAEDLAALGLPDDQDGAPGEWLIVRPREHHAAIAHFLMLAERGVLSDARCAVLLLPGWTDGEVWLRAVAERIEAVPFVPGLLVAADGVEIIAACQVAIGGQEPPGLPWPGAAARYGQVVPARQPLLLRILGTPFTVLLDLVTLPFQLYCLWALGPV